MQGNIAYLDFHKAIWRLILSHLYQTCNYFTHAMSAMKVAVSNSNRIKDSIWLRT